MSNLASVKSKVKYTKHYLEILSHNGKTSADKYADDFHFLNSVDRDTVRRAHIVEKKVLEKQKSTEFSKDIKISILTPLFNTPKQFLIELIESVQAQTYSNWELCLCDASDNEHDYVQDVVLDYQKKDMRISYKKLEENKGISENTNACIEVSTGQYFGLLDHDDILHPSALFEVMKCIEKGADFIYTDEVKFSGSIEDISNPLHFNCKGGFGIEELQSHNYICHFNVYSKELLSRLEQPYYRTEYDGSQDHDMVLRLTEKAYSIVHIPKVLYYWRFHDQSVSMNLDSKSYAVDAGIHAVQSQLNRKQWKGSVISNAPYRTIYKTKLSICDSLVSIVFYGNEKNINSVLKNTSYQNIEWVYGFESINVLKGDYILIYNSDLLPMNTNWIEELLMHAQKDKVGVVGAKIFNQDGSVYSGGIVFEQGNLFRIGSHNWEFEHGYEACLYCTRNTTAMEQDCILFKKELLDDFKTCDNSVQFCLKAIQNGYRNVWTSSSVLKSSIQLEYKNDKVKTLENFYEIVENDIYFNPLWKVLHVL